MAYLFAYSLLMDPEVMKQKCSPDARPLGPGRLKGFRLRFTSERMLDGTGLPNISPLIREDERAEVWGVIFKVPEEHLPVLDKCVNGLAKDFSGTPPADLCVFERFNIQGNLEIQDNNGKLAKFRYTCQAYSRISTERLPLIRKAPSMLTRSELIKIARSWGLPKKYIQETLNESHIDLIFKTGLD